MAGIDWLNTATWGAPATCVHLGNGSEIPPCPKEEM